MKLLTFAVASIVDANTHYLNGSSTADYSAAVRHGRAIRGKSVIESLKALARGLRSVVDAYRARRAEKRQIASLLVLNDALLEDIGLDRNDLLAAHYGVVSLEDLQNGREKRPDTGSGSESIGSLTDSIEQNDFAANEAVYATAKCA